MTTYDVVIPSSGRPSLAVLLAALGSADGPLPERVVIVDDRPAAAAAGPLDVRVPATLAGRSYVTRGPGRGPAAARNVGLRACDSAWIAFLDDDVLPPPGWRAALAADLDGLPAGVAGSQGRIRVPVRRDRPPTDWERNVAGLEDALWATADLAYRRSALAAVGGFDERFPRAYREDSDLGLRLVAGGWAIARGERRVLHPVGEADRAVSVRKQAGNADDALMATLHGARWRAEAGAPQGRLPWHAATAGAALVAAGLTLARRRRGALVAAAAWVAGTAELAWRRIAPGPRTNDEVATMLATSVVLPFAACWHRGAGVARARTVASRPGPVPERPAAVLLDRDGTLIEDVPYNGDPELVRPLPGVADAVQMLRAAGVPLAVVTNQSGIARGRVAAADVEAVNARVEALLGPFDVWVQCPHGPEDRCACRKPASGMVFEAARRLGVPAARCAMVGDIGSDVDAGAGAGARPVLVPTPVTRREEVDAAPEVCATLAEAVDRLLAGAPAAPAPALRAVVAGEAA